MFEICFIDVLYLSYFLYMFGLCFIMISDLFHRDCCSRLQRLSQAGDRVCMAGVDTAVDGYSKADPAECTVGVADHTALRAMHFLPFALVGHSTGSH